MIGRGYRGLVTYWAPTGKNLYGAQNAFVAPVTLAARWEDRQEKVVSAKGVEFVTTAVVFLPQHVDLGGYLAQGDQTSHADPSTLEGAHEIKKLSTIPDLRNVLTERRAYL